MNTTTSNNLINHIIQPFQRSLDEALRVMDCSIDEKRCQPAPANGASSSISHTDNISKSTHAINSPDLPLTQPHRPKSAQEPALTQENTFSQTPPLTEEMDTARDNPEAVSPETASMISSGATGSGTPNQKAIADAAPGRTELVSRALPAIEPNTTKTGNAELAVSGPDQIDAGPHGMPINNGGNSEKPVDKELSGNIPEFADRSPGTGRIERLQSPHRNTSLNPNVRETTLIDKSAALIPLKVPGKSPLPETVPTVELNSTIPSAPRSVRRAAGMVAEGLEPVLQQAYGISQQAFQPENAPVPEGDEAPPGTRVSNNFHVNVSMTGTNSMNSEQHEAIEEALVEILRLAARRHGLEV